MEKQAEECRSRSGGRMPLQRQRVPIWQRVRADGHSAD